MISKKNVVTLNILRNKSWISSWYIRKKEYPFLIQKDLVLISYVRSLLFDVNIYNSFTGLKLCRFNEILLIDIYLFYTVFSVKKFLTIFVTNTNIFFKENINLTLNKLSVSKICTNGFYVASRIAVLIEKRIKFRSKIIKSLLRKVKKNCLGIYSQCVGRINNANIARDDKLYVGSISLQTINFSISYGLVAANTVKGLQSIKVWINNF